MKTKLFFCPLFIILIFFIGCNSKKETLQEKIISMADNSMNSLDWAGTYKGVLPCADCDGIETVLVLNHDLTYKLSTVYLGKSDNIFESAGNFVWNDKGSVITLMNKKEEHKQQYMVGENKLFHLDKDGNKITGNLAYMYVLTKSGSDILNKYWKLVELMGKEVVRTEQMKREPHIIFRSEDKRVNGYAGCNTFTGSYEIQEGNRLRLSGLAMTMMACMDMNLENEFTKVLNNTDSYFVKNDTLFLYRARMAALARFEAVYFK